MDVNASSRFHSSDSSSVRLYCRLCLRHLRQRRTDDQISLVRSFLLVVSSIRHSSFEQQGIIIIIMQTIIFFIIIILNISRTRATFNIQHSTQPYSCAMTEENSKQSRKDSLTAVIKDYGIDDENLAAALVALGEATANISVRLTNYVEHTYAGTQNGSGDDQLHLDIDCDEAVFHAVRESGVFATVASEETPEETKVGDGVFSLGCDPLDGSSIIDANFSVGSIYGIWPGKTLLGRTGREQVAAAVALYGPRTVLCVALPSVNKVFEVTLVKNRASWEVSRGEISIEPSGKVFAPGNLRAVNDHEKYDKLVKHWIADRYTLRYSGGMVPDVYHIFTKSKGVFSNVSSPSARAKLRLLYEIAPIGLIVECAGGATTHEAIDKSVLDVKIESLNLQFGVCFGSTEEVKKFKEYMF